MRTLFALLACALLAWTPGYGAGRESPGEYQVKAVFLYNFAQFVEWPAGTFADERAPLVVGVLGTDPFGPDLDATLRGETAANRPFVVRRYTDVAEIDVCHILFISSSETAHIDEILTALKGRSILTVGDTEGFARRGGMIRFVTERNRIRLRISLDAAIKGQLTISSKLLRLAEIVPPGGS
jgi:hypothetical protein